MDRSWRKLGRPGSLLTLATLSVAIALGQQSLAAQGESSRPLGIALEAYRYPFPVHFFPLEIDGQRLRMAYMDISPTVPANGKTIVLLHGKNFGGYYWDNVIGELAAAGYRVIVPDQIGWGKSSKPDLHYSFDALASNTVELLDSLGVTQFILMGHSTGGMLAVRFALSYPERVGCLILEDPIGLEDYRIKIPPQSDETLFKHELENIDPQKIRGFYANYFLRPDVKVYGPLAEVQIRVTQSAEYPRWAKASALAYQMIYEQPVRYEFSRLKPSTLLIVGDSDHAAPLASYAYPALRQTLGHVPELARDVIKEVPHGKLAIIPNAGHIPHLEQPKAFMAEILTFLRERSP